jgi:hypothetical protein
MPIEIKELVIKATVVDGRSRDPAGPSEPGASRPAMNTEQIVETCVEQVLSILEQKRDR